MEGLVAVKDISGSNVTIESCEQSRKHPSPISVTERGMQIDINNEHEAKAAS
jgi:hypothetical protein